MAEIIALISAGSLKAFRPNTQAVDSRHSIIVQIRNGSEDVQDFDAEIMANSYAEVVFRLIRGNFGLSACVRRRDLSIKAADDLGAVAG
ncbi:hypothetical protein [Pseudomonas quasicaspiana]|uniref:hypothetical protein n=1 Tax=Pseudomonas quasicaspiana TaxID=2829821 RepID=UPI001E5700CB|nr:hypothetical protein [Pseudomonas quasicaspiana]MCD5974773.1 hypothetical protein [Pseudomonas quasicaspiana]